MIFNYNESYNENKKNSFLHPKQVLYQAEPRADIDINNRYHERNHQNRSQSIYSFLVVSCRFKSLLFTTSVVRLWYSLSGRGSSNCLWILKIIAGPLRNSSRRGFVSKRGVA